MGRLQELDRAFREARTFDPSELCGEYSVRMLTLMPSLHRLGHRKLFFGNDGRLGGTNLLFGTLRWGRFFLEEGVTQEPEALPVVVVNYDVAGNLPLTRAVRDHLRSDQPRGRYLGRLNVRLGNRLRFLAYFSLERTPGHVHRPAPLPERGDGRRGCAGPSYW